MISYSLFPNYQLKIISPVHPHSFHLKVTTDHNIDPAASAAFQKSFTQGPLLTLIGQNSNTSIAARESRKPINKPFSNKGNILSMFAYVLSERKWKWSHSVLSDSLRPHGLTVAHHALPSMGFSRQEYWSGLPFPSPEDLPNPGIELGSPTL